MLATGVRIGEVLAVLWGQVDFHAQAVTFDSTVIRVTGKGLLRMTTKTETSRRTLLLPAWAMLQRRFLANPRLDAPVPPHSAASVTRAMSAVPCVRRGVVKGSLGVTSHIADQLGHARPSITQDVYLGRNVANPHAVATLEDIFDTQSHPDGESHG